MLKPTDTMDEVRLVLVAASPGKGDQPHYMTAYQILGRLNEIRRQMTEERGGGVGAGAGVYYSAASVVEQACQMLVKRGEAELTYMATEGLWFDVDGLPPVRAGNSVCGLYRLRQ